VSDKPHRMCSSVHAPRGSNRARGHSRDDVRADVGPACGGKGDAPTDATDANTCCVTRPCTCTGVRLCRRRQESAHGGCLGLGGVSATTRRTGRVPCHTAGAHTVARSSTIAAVSRGVSKPEEQPLEQTAAVVDWEAAHRQRREQGSNAGRADDGAQAVAGALRLRGVAFAPTTRQVRCPLSLPLSMSLLRHAEAAGWWGV
jgi:hypothetical protein